MEYRSQPESEKRVLASIYWNAIYTATSKNNMAKELRGLIDIFSENVLALRNLNFPIDQWCFYPFSILLSKIDYSTRTGFDLKNSATEIPTYKNFIEFYPSNAELFSHCKLSPPKQPKPTQQITSNIPQILNRTHIHNMITKKTPIFLETSYQAQACTIVKYAVIDITR